MNIINERQVGLLGLGTANGQQLQRCTRYLTLLDACNLLDARSVTKARRFCDTELVSTCRRHSPHATEVNSSLLGTFSFTRFGSCASPVTGGDHVRGLNPSFTRGFNTLVTRGDSCSRSRSPCASFWTIAAQSQVW